MSHTDKLTATAIERVLKARVELTLSRRFYAVLVANVTPVPTSKVPTMATNGKQHFFNPAFVAELTQEQLLAVQAHESEHDARHHHTRRGSRDPELWNKATDYTINWDLKQEGFKLPSWALYDPRFAGLSAEDAYRILELDDQKRDNPQPQPEPEDDEDESESEEGEDESESDDGDGESEPEEGEPETEPEDETGGDAGDDEGEDEGEPAEGEGEGDDATDGKPGKGEAEEGDADGEGQPGDGQGEPTEGEAEAEGTSGTPGEAEGTPEPSNTSGDPGRMGEVLDGSTDAAELAEEEDRWERITRQAASMAKAVGQLPGHVSREIERANHPAKDWRETLRDWVDQGNLRIETWNRRNRRHIGRGTFLPGSQRDGVNKIACIVDTSGSVDDIALAAVKNEMQAMLDDGVISELVVVYADTRVTRTDEYREGDDIALDAPGGGGSDMKPAFEWVRDNVENPSGIICFTDLYISPVGDEPECPVMWAVHGYPETVRSLIASAPWGAPGVDVGQH
jgi:predicted metal-dependent peptidase